LTWRNVREKARARVRVRVCVVTHALINT